MGLSGSTESERILRILSKNCAGRKGKMGNSTTTLQKIVDYTKTYPELNPVLAMGGFSQQPALDIASDVGIQFFAQPHAWKFNRFKYPPFYTNSFQQDYAFNVSNLAWLENGVFIDINNTSQPKLIEPMEVNRDLPESSLQYGRPGQASWLPNDQLQYAIWGGGNLGIGKLSNPGPGSVYGPLVGGSVLSQPSNPVDQIVDPNGNFWRLFNYIASPTPITLGSVQPTWPTAPVYPTYANPATVATTVTDGQGIWTALNPKGQGIRVNPIPSQQGRVWQGKIFAQMRPPQFSSLSQTIDPIPDDFAAYFRRGFVAYTYMHSKDAKIAGKFQVQQALWLASIEQALKSADRERDNMGIYPSEGIMNSNTSPYLGPADPYAVG